MNWPRNPSAMTDARTHSRWSRLGDCFRQVNISEAHISTGEVKYRPEYIQWFETLSEREQEKIDTTLKHVQLRGSNTKRPYVGHIRGSRYHKMKELRVSKGIRILLISDSQQTIVVLVGGNKSEQEDTTPNWNRWYKKMIPIADRIFMNYEIEQGESKWKQNVPTQVLTSTCC